MIESLAFLLEMDPKAADALREGCYLLAPSRKNTMPVPVQVLFGPPLDPETGEPLDRAPRWQILVAGVLLDAEPLRIGRVSVDELSDVWPVAAANPISQADYDFRIERAEWASEFDPCDPFASPGQRINPLTATLPLFD